MKQFVKFFWLGLLTSIGALTLSSDLFGRETRNFNDDWTFARVIPKNYRSEPIRTFKVGDVPPTEQTEESKTVRLPHDWAIELGFNAVIDGHTGKLPWRGIGVYSKTLTLSAEDLKNRYVLSFDGVMAFPEVTINGVYAGGWDYGYLGFQVDATPFLHEGENLIKVRCDTREHRSRWYPGAGIYRNVDLIVTSRELWLPEGSVWIVADVQPETTTSGSADLLIRLSPDLEDAYKDASVGIRITEKRENGETIFEKKVDGVTFRTGRHQDSDAEKFVQYSGPTYNEPRFELTAQLDKVRLWDVDEPNLYLVDVIIFNKDGAEIDSVQIPFGFRKAEFTVDDGFYLNGRRVQLYGVDLHHDQGLIGAASHPAAIHRQLSIMRDMGANAIRTSHNPNSSAFMDLCDEMGFIVWDELFDKWDGTAGLRPVKDDFFDFSERQAAQFVRRDRNRPSVCAWSIGNEIASIEANYADASNPDKDAKKRVAHLCEAVKKYDQTRLIGLGCYVENVLGDNPPKVDSLSPLSIMGWNYGAKYRQGRKSYPNVPVVYTESSSAFSTRGHYVLNHPEKKDQYDERSWQVDSYDLISANGPRDIPDYDFYRMEQDRYVAGEFVWTGFDYLGEPAPFERFAKSSYFGIVDLCGTPKDRFYLYRSYWNRRDTTVHILPHWNWDYKPTPKDRSHIIPISNSEVNWEGKTPETVPVYVYTSGDSAELFLNGKSLGRRAKDPSRTLEKPSGVEFDLPDYYWIVDKYRIRWEDVPYEPGVLEVVAYQNDVEIGRSTVRTAGDVAALKVSPEKDAFESDDDLVYINIQAVDADGRPCPWARNQITVQVNGAATLAGLGNGNPIDLDSFADASHRLFYGSATLILRSNKGARGGTVKVKLLSDKLPDAACEIRIPD